jgi:hypothetical protein
LRTNGKMFAHVFGNLWGLLPSDFWPQEVVTLCNR